MQNDPLHPNLLACLGTVGGLNVLIIAVIEEVGARLDLPCIEKGGYGPGGQFMGLQ